MRYVPSHGIAITVLTNDGRAQAAKLPASEPPAKNDPDLGLLVDELLLTVLEHIQDS